jgi:hypothetical protein
MRRHAQVVLCIAGDNAVTVDVSFFLTVGSFFSADFLLRGMGNSLLTVKGATEKIKQEVVGPCIIGNMLLFVVFSKPKTN